MIDCFVTFTEKTVFIVDKRSDIELCDIVALPLKLNKVRKRGEEKESARPRRLNLSVPRMPDVTNKYNT